MDCKLCTSQQHNVCTSAHRGGTGPSAILLTLSLCFSEYIKSLITGVQYTRAPMTLSIVTNIAIRNWLKCWAFFVYNVGEIKDQIEYI